MRETKTEDQSASTTPSNRIFRLEVNLLTFPLFTLDKSRAGKPGYIKCHIQKGGRDIEWLVTSQDIPKELQGELGRFRYGGMPGPFDKDTFFAIMWDIETLPKPVRNAYLIKETGRYRTREELFRPFTKVIFTGEEDEKGDRSERNIIFIDEYLLSNINNRFVKPIDYEFYMGLKRPGTRRLFEILDPKFFAVKKAINLRYSTQCQLFPCERQVYLSDARKIITPFCDELYKWGYLSDVEWERTDDKKDWLIHYHPGSMITGHEAARESSISSIANRKERFRNFFMRKYSQKFRKKLYISKKDEESIEGLINVFSDDDLKNLVLQFFRSSDPFITKSSYAISVFSSAGVINKLNIEVCGNESEEEEKKRRQSFKPPDDKEYEETREEIKRFTREFC